MNNRQPSLAPKITALYSRLSKDDERMGESLSIENQRAILEDYAKKKGFQNLVHYVDDGWSGTDFSRPDWKRMIADVEADKVGCVITKTIDRLGRDHLQVGFHTEVVFRQHGVRFIAIGNNIDSDIQESTEFAPFLNIFAEWYARDTSRKIKAVAHAKGNAGRHMTNSALYGYRKSPDDKNVWLVDEEAAAVVRRIFQMTIDGMGPYKIARALTDEKVLRPIAYIALRDGYEIANTEDKCNWNGATVSGMLDKPEYWGATVNFRTFKESYKDKKVKHRPPEEWLVFEDTQPPIVDRETWETAQKCRNVKRRPNSTGEPNPLTGLVFCADCGAKMYNHRGPLADKYDSHDTYTCNRYSKYPRKCSMHYIKTSTLETLALEAIRAVSGYVRENEAEFLRQVQELHDLQSAEAVKIQQKQLAKSRKRHRELDSLIRQIYEDKVRGELSTKRFEILSGEYESEQEDLERQITELDSAVSAFSDGNDNAGRFIKMVRRYSEIPELTAAILNEYIQKIVVSEADRSSGRREQNVDFFFNFIGKFPVPGQTEPEPFDPEEHRRKILRDSYQRNREKILAKLAEKRAAEKAAKLASMPVKTPEELAAEEEARRERKRAYMRDWKRKRREKQSKTA
jgi:DNA invertase Pin-like site-specific DNA recombinase